MHLFVVHLNQAPMRDLFARSHSQRDVEPGKEKEEWQVDGEDDEARTEYVLPELVGLMQKRNAPI